MPCVDFAARRGVPVLPPALLAWRAQVARERMQESVSAVSRAALLQAGLEALVQAAVALMAEEVAEKAGDRYERWPERKGYRNGTAPGWIAVGGRKVRIRRPRICDADGREVPLATYEAMQDEQRLDETMLTKVIQGVAQARVHRGLAVEQPLPEDLRPYGDSRSSVARRWIRAAASYLEVINTRRLDDRRYLAILIDGKGFGEHVVLCALGIDEQGNKVPLGVREGNTESTEVCMAFLDELEARGLDVRRGVLVVTDGGGGIRAAIKTKWGDVALLGRCQEHKKRNVLRHLPKREQRWVERALWRAWHEPDAGQAERDLWALVAELEGNWPEAARSLREGLAETLTCQRLGLPAELITALRTTNLIENLFSTAGGFTRRVCRWRSGEQALRWAKLALREAEPGLHPVAGPEAMAVLREAIDAALANVPRVQRLPLAG